MADKQDSKEQRDHNRGQQDGAKYKEQGLVDYFFNPFAHNNPPNDKKGRDDYYKGHKNGRR